MGNNKLVLNINYQNNIYYCNNPELFLELKSLIEEFPRSYFNMLRRNGYIIRHGKQIYEKSLDRTRLMNWINDMLPMLFDKKYNMATRCYWIMHGLTDFPSCKHCHKSDNYKNKNVKDVKNGYYEYCSTKCMANSEYVNESKKHTCVEKYNATTIMGSEYFKEKSRSSKKEKYGNEYYFDKGKARQTRIEKYGKWESDCSTQKRKDTNIEKYGVENVFAAEPVKNTIKQTCIDRYGVEYNQQNPEIHNKGIKTKIEKYGSIGISFSYKYLNILFDSMPEMAFYIYLKDKDINFIFHPKESFEYIFDGKKHIYIPDFKINDKFYEIKGDMFFEDRNPHNAMICPWDYSKNELYEAKHQCMITNGVIILTSSDYNRYIDYCNIKFTSAEWYKQYRVRDGKFFS